MATRTRSIAWLVAIAVALVAVAAPQGEAGAAGTKPVASAFGRLTGQTTIRWTGNKGITLTGPRKQNVFLPQQNMYLYVKGGGFAFVFIEPAIQPSADTCPGGLPRCFFWWLGYVRDGEGRRTVGRDHVTVQDDPPDFSQSLGIPLRFYLMTDGEATLVLRPQGLRGTTSYVAAGRIRATAGKLPTSCTMPECDSGSGYANSLQFGGAAHDVGKLGVFGALGYTASAPATNDAQRIRGDSMIAPLRICGYPSPFHPEESGPADPAAHPWGCDVTAQDPTDLNGG